MIAQTAQEAAAVVEAWQHRFDKYLQLTDELVRTMDRKIMCINRAMAARRQMVDQDPASFFWELVDAVLWGDPWPGGDLRLWKRQEKSAEVHARSIEKEREALGDPSFSDLKDSLAGLQTWCGPLSPGSSVHTQDGRELPLKWVFIEHGGRIFFLAEDGGGSSVLLGGDSFSSALMKWREAE